MSVVVAVKKGNQICLASDTQANFGSITVAKKYLVNYQKIYKSGKSYVGMVGWMAVGQIVEHLIESRPEALDFSSRLKIFESMLALQKSLKEEYFIETSEDSEQPVESNQISALVINKSGIFEIESYRDINQYNEFWAIGSGRRFAIGALHALYNRKLNARDIAIAAVEAAAEFDESCGLPVEAKTIRLK